MTACENTLADSSPHETPPTSIDHFLLSGTVKEDPPCHFLRPHLPGAHAPGARGFL